MLVLNCLECFDRADFATTIVGLLSIIFLSENEFVNRDHFRYIPVLMLITIIYDCIWLFAIQDRAREGAATDGGIEANIVYLALLFNYIQLFFKVSQID